VDHKQPTPPRNLAGYFEALTRIVFQSGMSWRVVEAKWPGIRAAFRELDPERVARMTARDIDRLSKDTRVIRNVAKIEATVLNAREMVALDKAPGGFKKYLRSLNGFEEARPALRKRFRFLGDHGSYYFLWSVGEKVPSWEDWTRAPRRKPPARSRAVPKPR
jgi:3-methyladenine DNA glycosylase Tag